MLLNRLLALSLLALIPSPGFAQKVTATAHTATASGTIVPNPAGGGLGVIDETFALSDALVRELRRGGYVLYMRHGATQENTVDTLGAGEWWKDCSATQRLSPSALPQAQATGMAWSRQQIFFSEVYSSEFCRTADTGVFLGTLLPTRTPALNAASYFQSLNRPLTELDAGVVGLLANTVVAGKNRLLIGHQLPTSAVHPSLSTLPEGHTAIFRPLGGNRFTFVTTLSPGQWQWIGKQPIADQAAASAPQVVVAPPTLLPVIDPAKEIKGLPLLAALRRGGLSLYMRHAVANVGSDQDFSKVARWWEDCMIQRNIAPAGREQARKVGAAVKALNIPIADIKVSQFCRVRDTGHALALGAVEVVEDLNHVIGQRAGTDVNQMRYKLLATSPTAGRNNLYVSHTHGSPRNEERVMGQIAEAEIVVFRPDGKGATEPIARISVQEWDNLMSLAGVSIPLPATPPAAPVAPR